MILICILVLLVIALWKWWAYRCLTIGLMYYAKLEHDWDVDDAEMKKILDHSIKRNIKDLLRLK